jgi:tetratricopeptide (TPR) repeat protein
MCRVFEDRHGLLSRFRRRINGSAAVLVAGAVLLLYVALFSLLRLGDGALFVHLASGDRIAATRQIPRNDPFSYTALGLRWLDETWLFDLSAAGMRALGGLSLVRLLAAAGMVALFLSLYRRGLRHGPPALVAAVLLLLATACRDRLVPGPDLVSFWLLVVCLAAVAEALTTEVPGRRRRLLWIWLPLVVLLWTNVQALFVLAPLVTLLACLSEAGLSALAWRRDAGGEKPSARLVDLLVSLALQSVAALANPYGAMGVRVPFDRATAPPEARALLWQAFPDLRPLLSGSLLDPPVMATLVLAGLAALAIAVRARRTGIRDALVLVAFALLALRARGLVPLLALAAAFFLLQHLESVSPAQAAEPEGRRGLLPAALVAIAALGLGVQALRPGVVAPPDRVPLPGLGLIPGAFPKDAAGFVAQAGLPGQVFHPLSVGGFLIDAWKRDRLVFMDDRADPFLHGALATYLDMLSDPEVFERAVDQYQITTVLWPHRDAAAARPLLRHLATASRWVLTDLDPDAAIWVRGDVLSPPLVEREPVAPGRPPSAAAPALERQLDAEPAQGPPRREQHLAEFYMALGDAPGAEIFLKRALQLQPRNAPLWAAYGEVLEDLGRRDEALGAYRAALRLDPRAAKAAGALGALLLEDGRGDEARRLLEIAWEAGDRRPRTLEARGRMLEGAGRAGEAGRAWDEAVRVERPERDALLGAARFRVRRGDTETALVLYERARTRAPDDAVVAKESAELLESAGHAKEALDAVRGPAEGAVERLTAAEASPAGQGNGASARRADRELLIVAARLARRAGDEERARAWEAAAALNQSH